jgi:hypothetical protein
MRYEVFIDLSKISGVRDYSLLTYLLIYRVNDLEVAGALLAGAYLPLLSLGVYLLGRQFGLDRATALLYSLVIATGNFLLYWTAGSWHNHLVGSVWFVWSWLFIDRLRGGGPLAFLGFIGTTYLLLTSGFPQAGIALGVLATAYLFRALQLRSWVFAASIAVGGLVALLLAGPSLLPAVFTLAETTRATEVSNHGFLTPTLGDFLQVGSPAFLPKIKYWGGVDMHVPIFYLAWFIPTLLAFVDWKQVPRKIPRLLPPIIALGFTLLLGTGPENLGPLRYPVRFILFAHPLAAAVCLVILFRSGPLIISQKRATLAGGLIVLGVLVAILEEPAAWRVNIYAGIAMTTMGAAALLLYRKEGKSALAGGLLAGTALVFVATHVAVPRNPDIPDFYAPTMREGSAPWSLEPYSGYALFLGKRVSHEVNSGVAEL